MGTDLINDGIYNARLSYLECPSHPEAGTVSDYMPGTQTSYSRRNAIRTSYFFSTGGFTDGSTPADLATGSYNQGMFGNESGLKLGAVTDGLSNSLACGEGAGGNWKTSTHYGPWGMTGVHTCCHGRVSATLNTTTGVLAPTAAEIQGWSINGVWPGNALGQSYAWTFNSKHTGGAQFVFGDGSVHFLSQSMDFTTLAKLAYIHDGYVVGEF